MVVELNSKYRVKIIVDGDCAGEAVVIDKYISFFGEVDPDKGLYIPEKIEVKGRVLVFKGSRGSTVGSYILYGLKKRKNAPICMIVSETDPVLVAGAVLAEIPLLMVKDYLAFIENVKGRIVRHRRGEDWVEIVG